MQLKFYITIDTDTQEFEIVNQETGEIKKAPVRKKKEVVEESNTPQLILLDNKYVLNSKAVELLQVEPGMRLDIKFETNGTPVIGTDQAFKTPGVGNELTKSYTVRYSGSKNARLAECGNTFEIIPHPINEDIFILHGDKPVETPVEEEVIEVPDEIDLAELLDLGDEKTEVKGIDFNLNF